MFTEPSCLVDEDKIAGEIAISVAKVWNGFPEKVKNLVHNRLAVVGRPYGATKELEFRAFLSSHADD